MKKYGAVGARARLCSLSAVRGPLVLLAAATAFSRGPFPAGLGPEGELEVVGGSSGVGGGRTSVDGLATDLGAIVVACGPLM